MATATKKKTSAAKAAASARSKTSAGSRPILRVQEGSKPDAKESADATTKAPTAAATAAPTPTVVSEEAPQAARPLLRKKELIEQVVTRSGIRKKMAKPAVEAALAVLGDALAEGREMNLPPLGKLRINRTKTVGGGRVFITKIRRAEPSPNPPLAEVEEDS